MLRRNRGQSKVGLDDGNMSVLEPCSRTKSLVWSLCVTVAGLEARATIQPELR